MNVAGLVLLKWAVVCSIGLMPAEHPTLAIANMSTQPTKSVKGEYPRSGNKQEDATPAIWHWTDIELMGHHSVSRKQILEHIPLKVGTEYAFDRSLWNQWSKDLKSRFDFHAVHISAVRFTGGKAYLVINVVERGNEHHDSFREAPEGNVELPADLVKAYEHLSEYHRTLFEKGTPPAEHANAGFLDYHEPEMSRRVTKLVELAPPHRQTLLDAIANDSDPATRATAATLLNWAGETRKSTLAVLPLLNDPSVSVRNNLTRFMLHYFDQLTESEDRRTVIDCHYSAIELAVTR